MPALAYMPFYTADFLADERVASMSFAERGLYVTLLCHAWREGSIPSDVTAIARLVQRPVSEVRAAWKYVSECFTEEGNRLVQRRMETIRAEVEATTQRRSEAGRKGAERRWKGDGPAITDDGPAIAGLPLQFDGNQNQSQRDTETTYSSSTSSPRSANGKRSRVPWVAPPIPDALPSQFPVDVDDLKPIADAFLDAFGNTRAEAAVSRRRPAYLSVLATFRSRGASVGDAWDAFSSACLAQDGKPLFGANAKIAISYLPQRARGGAGRLGPYDTTPLTIAPEDRR